MSEDTITDLINGFFQGGWRVAPFVKTNDGYIGVKSWPKRAATNPAELTDLVTELRQKSMRPHILGIVPAVGRYVVDIDTKKNTEALQLWKDKVIEAYGDASLASPNLVVKTKSGGYHLYYSDGSTRIIHSPIGVFGKDSGIDIRGYTGMVVAPTFVGTETDWQPGEYVVVKGLPNDSSTVLGLSKIAGDFDTSDDLELRRLLKTVNEILRNDSVGENSRWKLIPDTLLIPSSSRDNTLYRCARLCRLADLSQDAAMQFMAQLAMRCEATAEEPTQHWIELSADKVRRVYSDDKEVRLQSVSAFYEELDNAGTILLRGVSKAYFYFRHGSKLLRIDPRSKFSVENIGNVLQGLNIYAEDEAFPAKKALPLYNPREVAYDEAMFPKPDTPFFEYQGKRYVNSYHDPFIAFEPEPELLAEAEQYADVFEKFILHITGGVQTDADRLLDKLAWIVQKPYRRMPTATIIYSHTKGSGKDTLMLLVREIVGQRYYMPINLRSLQNPHLTIHDKLVCVASEVQLQANARGSQAAAAFMGDIKDLTTAKHVEVNEKFLQSYNAPIYTNFFILSNFELSAILEPGDRRFDIFHSTESKMDQNIFGKLADVGTDTIWIDRSERDRKLRKHIIYALRRMLADRPVADDMDRREAVENEVKLTLMESHNPPVLQWMFNNLPVYFTEEIAMMACHFCPIKAMPEYIIKQMKEHFGPQMRPIYRASRQLHRMNGSPRLEIRSDNGREIPVINFDIPTGDAKARRAVYTLDPNIPDVNATDATMKSAMRLWYEMMLKKYFANITQLPAAKPDSEAQN